MRRILGCLAMFLLTLVLAVASAPAQTSELSAFDVLQIQAAGTIPEWPIDGLYLVESTGHVSLGPPYGRVQLRDCSLEDIERCIELHLRRYLQDPAVQVSVAGPVKRWTAPTASQGPFRIQPGYLLSIQLMGGLPDQPSQWEAKVDEKGRIALGPVYGRVEISGLGLEEAEVAITKHLATILQSPQVAVTHAGWLLEEERGDDVMLRLQRLESEVELLKAAISELQSGSPPATADPSDE